MTCEGGNKQTTQSVLILLMLRRWSIWLIMLRRASWHDSFTCNYYFVRLLVTSLHRWMVLKARHTHRQRLPEEESSLYSCVIGHLKYYFDTFWITCRRLWGKTFRLPFLFFFQSLGLQNKNWQHVWSRIQSCTFSHLFRHVLHLELSAL